MQIAGTSEMGTLNIITGWEINFKIRKGKRVKIRRFFPPCKTGTQLVGDNYRMITQWISKLCHYRKIQILGMVCLSWC